MSSVIQCVQMNFFQQMILLNELQNSDTPGCQYQTPCLCLSCILAFVKIFWPSFHGNLFTFNLFGSPVEKLMIQLPGCSAPPVTSVLLYCLAVSALKKSQQILKVQNPLISQTSQGIFTWQASEILNLAKMYLLTQFHII